MSARTDFFAWFIYPFGALFLLLPSLGRAETRSVDCDAGGSITGALTALKPGDTLLVSGTCVENVEVAGQNGQFDGINLDGQGTATIRGADSSLDDLRLATVRGATVRGFRVTGGRDAIHVRWGTDVFIMNNTIEQTARNGIQVTRGSWVQIVDNVVQNNPRNGIEVQESTARIGSAITDDAAQPNPNRIEGNGGQGIVVSRGSTVRIAGNTIRSNGQNGVYVEKMSQADISSNGIEGNALNGIQVIQNSGVNLGADTGTSYESLPNSTGTPNGQWGIDCSLVSYAAGRLGTLMGAKGLKNFTTGAYDSLLP
jgi:parallel beta-helix repeat protein